MARSVDYVAPHVRLITRDSLLRRRNIKRQVVARNYWICQDSRFGSCVQVHVQYILLALKINVELYRLILCLSCTKSHDLDLFRFRHQKRVFSFLLWSFRLSFSASYFFFRRPNLGICRFVASGTTDAHVSLRRATKLQSCVAIHNSSCYSDKIISHLSPSGSTQRGDQRVEGG